MESRIKCIRGCGRRQSSAPDDSGAQRSGIRHPLYSLLQSKFCPLMCTLLSILPQEFFYADHRKDIEHRTEEKEQSERHRIARRGVRTDEIASCDLDAAVKYISDSYISFFLSK